MIVNVLMVKQVFKFCFLILFGWNFKEVRVFLQGYGSDFRFIIFGTDNDIINHRFTWIKRRT